MKWQHYITNIVSHQNTCNYSLSAIEYNNYIDSYNLGKTYFIVELWNYKRVTDDAYMAETS